MICTTTFKINSVKRKNVVCSVCVHARVYLLTIYALMPLEYASFSPLFLSGPGCLTRVPGLPCAHLPLFYFQRDFFQNTDSIIPLPSSWCPPITFRMKCCPSYDLGAPARVVLAPPVSLSGWILYCFFLVSILQPSGHHFSTASLHTSPGTNSSQSGAPPPAIHVIRSVSRHLSARVSLPPGAFPHQSPRLGQVPFLSIFMEASLFRFELCIPPSVFLTGLQSLWEQAPYLFLKSPLPGTRNTCWKNEWMNICYIEWCSKYRFMDIEEHIYSTSSLYHTAD